MIVTTWGTRGSTAVAGPDKVKYGGNTTCVEISSRCLPDNLSLCVDGGTGMVPYGKELVRKMRMTKERSGATQLNHELVCLLTHYHWDHIQGIPLSPVLYSKDISLTFVGPDDSDPNKEAARGTKMMLSTLLQHPFFPVGFHEVASRIRTKSIYSPAETILAFHPTGGKEMLALDEFEVMERSETPIVNFGVKGSYPLNECLIVKMYKSNHPEYTISYRFEERPTGKVFVFLTDHEVTASFSSALLRHVKGANLVIEDAQYLEDTYQAFAAGFGHGTGPYCVKLVKAAGGVTSLGLTHHDPFASDQDVESVLSEALEEAEPMKGLVPETEGGLTNFLPITIFACADYQQIQV
jgi:phosphoribosyl 1,2-cyclic phosphodiesterase